MYAIIMAGGSGTRLWPKSRENSPKQLHSLVLGPTMLQDTINRLTPLIPQRDVFIVTNKNYLYKVKAQVPGIPVENLLSEDEPIGTALAIGYALIKLSKINPDAIVTIGWSDNYIKKTKEFLRVLKLAERVASEGHSAIIGVNPAYPSTAYGYIKIGREIKELGKRKVFLIDKFIEKPTLSRAKKFVESWDYLWNSGIAVSKVSTLLSLYEKHIPFHFEALLELSKYLDTDKELEKMRELFQPLERLSIDVAIWEKAKKITVIPSDLGWSDVGSWASLKEVLMANKSGNLINAKFVGLDTKNCLVYGGERLIATIGLENIIIVDTDDAVLVCPIDQAQKVKELVTKLKKEGKQEYL